MINGINLPVPNYTVFEGSTFVHIHCSTIDEQTKEFILNIKEEPVSVSFFDEEEFREYPQAKIIFFGNSTFYVCSWIN